MWVRTIVGCALCYRLHRHVQCWDEGQFPSVETVRARSEEGSRFGFNFKLPLPPFVSSQTLDAFRPHLDRHFHDFVWGKGPLSPIFRSDRRPAPGPQHNSLEAC